jgi:hypothetical protein
MTAIHETLEQLTLGDIQHAGRLTIVPLGSAEQRSPDYALLSAAQAEGLATVSEVSESGTVPELLLTNAGSLALFLLDGEELIGAKQNRIVNLSILIPAESTHIIPVSCVEAGRWDYRSKDFASSDRVFFSRGRARKAADVTEHLSEAGYRGANQSAVWEDVSEALVDFKVNSGTQAVSDLYEQQEAQLAQLIDVMAANDDTVGAVFLIDGQVCGLELFDAAPTWQQLMPKVLRGYGIDALRGDAGDPSTTLDPDGMVAEAKIFIESVCAADTRRFEAVGEGEDLRFMDKAVTGGALQARGRIIHLCAFAADSAHGRRSSHGHEGLYQTEAAGVIDDLFTDDSEDNA